MQILGSKKISPWSDKPPQTTANRVSENRLTTLGQSPKEQLVFWAEMEEDRDWISHTSRVGLEVEGKTKEKN